MRATKKGETVMRKGIKAKPEEIISTLRQIEILANQGNSIQMACREAGITEQTFYRWRKQYGGMQLPHIKEMKKLQEENARLKKIVADLTLEKLILNEVVEGKF